MFSELYEHRIELYIALLDLIGQINVYLEYDEHVTWKSKLHSDGSNFDGWFILGISMDNGKQISYHLPMSYWDRLEWVTTLDKAPEFDGHTSKDVLERLKEL